MNILLTHGYFLCEDEKEKKIMRPYPPLGLLYIAAWLDENGYPSDVFDTTFKTKSELLDHVTSTAPDVIGIYTNLMTKVNVVQLMQLFRTSVPLANIVLGGPDVRYNSEDYLRHGADVLVIGEGEQTMLDVISHLENKKSITEDIAGIAFLRDGIVITSPEREKLRDLDLLPIPARQKINMDDYLNAWTKHHGQNAISVSTMRGCPYTCKWCSRGVYGLSYRRRSPENVVKELKQLQQHYKFDSVWFVDDVFTISHKWLTEFAAALARENVTIRYECISRADRMNPNVVKLLKETGCFRVWIGAESGSQKVIDLMDRRVEVGQVREMIRLTRAAGMEAGTFIMLGYPGETEQDIRQTIRHLKDSNPDHFTITVAYPIKGTEFFDEITITDKSDDWGTVTDRQTRFKKTYRDRYYGHAVRHVITEVYGKKALDQKQRLQFFKWKIKSLIARAGMFASRW